MVRFQSFDDASDDADLRSKRGAHIVVFEDGDAGPALRAATPFLKWSDVEASPALPFAEFVDFTLRVMKMPPGTLNSAKVFALNQITAGPLNHGRAAGTGVWLTAGSRGSRQLRNDTAVTT